MGSPRITFLVGAGASMPAGLPGTAAITDRVLKGNDISRHTHQRFYLGTSAGMSLRPGDPQVACEFAGELAAVARALFPRVGITREVNYEDIHYLARQIADCLIGEYENPGLAALIEELASKFTSGNWDILGQRADMTADYITDIVWGLLGSRHRDRSCLGMVIDACSDTTIRPVDIVTLNHDTLLEKGLRRRRVAFADGFGRQFGDVMIWSDTYPEGQPRLFKLHGSLDWIRLEIDKGQGRYQADVRALKPDIDHLRDPNGALFGFPLNDGRPVLLVGTFNKLYDYSGGVFGDQHARFRARLRNTDRLVVAGYGFGDKGINRALIEWLMTPGDKRMVVVHPDPDALASGLRYAIGSKWAWLESAGKLVTVAKGIEQVNWAEVKALF